MAVYKIVELGDPVLRQKSSPVPEVNGNIQKLLDNLAETLYAAKGLGLAAPQIGISKRVIVVDCGEGLWEVVNPEIVSMQGQDVGVEGCLSIPGVSGEVEESGPGRRRGVGPQCPGDPDHRQRHGRPGAPARDRPPGRDPVYRQDYQARQRRINNRERENGCIISKNSEF